jgi:hypothetical protein
MRKGKEAGKLVTSSQQLPDADPETYLREINAVPDGAEGG